MPGTRAIMTETERERIAHGKYEDDFKMNHKRQQAAYNVRKRIEEELPKDLKALADGYPELFEELKETICAEEWDTTADDAPTLSQ